jgi:hypothetical protein
MSCTAVMAGMAAGLIPVATASTDIELGDFGVEVAGDTVEAVDDAVRAVANMSPGELHDMSRAARAATFSPTAGTASPPASDPRWSRS